MMALKGHHQDTRESGGDPANNSLRASWKELLERTATQK